MVYLLIKSAAIIFATTLHEFVRALCSHLLGDKKPKNDGRLTLNPVKHFEPVGFILCLASGFGWGKPVQTNGMYYKNRKRDSLIVAIMPTVSNLLAAFLFGLAMKVIPNINTTLYLVLASFVNVNITLAVFNLVPITPMDCSKVVSSILPANRSFAYLRQEKSLQLLFLLALFWGYADIVINPVINLVYRILDLGLMYL